MMEVTAKPKEEKQKSDKTGFAVYKAEDKCGKMVYRCD